MTATATGRRLTELARCRGIQLGYTAQDGRRVRASTETLVAVLTALGHPVSDAASIEVELGLADDRYRSEAIEPVLVWRRPGRLSSPLRVPGGLDLSACWAVVTTEAGSVHRHRLDDLVVEVVPSATDDIRLVWLDLRVLDLSVGYHEFTVEGLAIEPSLLLVPPPAARVGTTGFGVFAPLYALRSAADWGVGSFTELAGFTEVVGKWGGQLAGTLPLFATFFRDPVDPSPYLPVSRLFWNELYVDVDSLPELTISSEAAGVVGSQGFQADLTRLRGLARADHGGVMAQKRRVLELCAESLITQPGDRRDALDAYVKSQPELERYADFRATDESIGRPWHDWPSQPGELPPDGASPRTVLYHRYAQFVAAEQLAAAATGTGAGLYLDLPVGVHPDGFDTWTSPELFGRAGVGAPPDPFFEGGQSWGFPPLHPDRIREDRYRYLIDTYREVFAHSRAVRIDHVLGLQRLFWIPDGCGADGGAYVRYRSEETRAIIAIEAARAGTVVVGEDLGVVPPGIRRAMDDDGMLHTFVYQFEASVDHPLPQPRRPSMSSLGSHDLPKFATYWETADPAVKAAVAPPKSDARQSNARAALATTLSSLATGPSSYLLLDLGDLTGETIQDNRPGTGPEEGNWRARLSRPLTDIAAAPDVIELVSMVRAGRESAAVKGVDA